MGNIGMASWFIVLFILTGQPQTSDGYGMGVLPQDFETPAKVTVTVGGIDITTLQWDGLRQAVEHVLEQQQNRLVRIQNESTIFEKPRAELGLGLAMDMDWILEDIERFRQSYLFLELSCGGDFPLTYEYTLPLAYEEKLMDKWIRAIKQRADEPMTEHGLVLSDGRFLETAGDYGMEIPKATLKRRLTQTLNDTGTGPIHIEVAKKEVFPIRDKSALKMVNARISGFSSYFPLYQTGRTENVRIAASRIDKTILMPGDEFSYEEKVSPVVAAAGYRHATIFMNGQPVSGLGGGICQVSSTMYNAQLKAGIKASSRMNHSLIVDYVPRGQDATVAEGFIDYRFVNTLDYPIYIHATTYGGTLTIEFWSNENALNGMTYLPRTLFKGLTEDGRRKYDTTLYGYNKSGELVYEEFMHRSLYKQKG